MKGNSQQKVTLVWFIMFAIISFVIAGVMITQNNGTIENKWWFAKKEKPKTEMTEDEEINELNNLIYDYEYVEPEETMREKVLRETNERHIKIIGIQDID